METRNGVAAITAETREKWRGWLKSNHQSEKSIWLIMYKKDSGRESVTYDEAVEEALCFGWIDSKPNKRDEQSYYQFFSKRNPKSNWSRKNKQTIQKLTKSGKMSEAGLEMIHLAKKTGTWTALDDVENLIIPPDLKTEFEENPVAFEHYEAFPRSVKRSILEWILNAKRPETRAKRIQETVEKASQNIRANQYRQ